MIEKYLIFEGFDRSDLIKQINVAIGKKGWTPQGGISVCYDNLRERNVFYQAMVKHK